MPGLLAAAHVFVTLCLAAPPQGCLTPPILLEAEVWSQRTLHDVQVRWFLDGEFVASDRLPALGPEAQRIAMILNPARIQHQVAVALAANGVEASDQVALPPVCPSLLQLEDFRWDSHGLQVRLSNLGPGSSGRVGFRWTVNGLLYSTQSLDPLPAGSSAELHLPASASPLLQKALRGSGPKGERLHLIPVVVSLEATPGPSDLESPSKAWQFFLGFVMARGSAGQR